MKKITIGAVLMSLALFVAGANAGHDWIGTIVGNGMIDDHITNGVAIGAGNSTATNASGIAYVGAQGAGQIGNGSNMVANTLKWRDKYVVLTTTSTGTVGEIDAAQINANGTFPPNQTMGGNLTVSSNLLAATAQIPGAVTLGSTLTVTGAVSMAAAETVAGVIYAAGGINDTGAVRVVGASTLIGATEVAAALVQHNGNAAFSNNVTVTSNLLASTFQAGASTLASTLTVTGNVSAVADLTAATLHVPGAATFGSTVMTTGVVTFTAAPVVMDLGTKGTVVEGIATNMPAGVTTVYTNSPLWLHVTFGGTNGYIKIMLAP